MYRRTFLNTLMADVVAPAADPPLGRDVSQSHIEIILADATVRVCGAVSSATLRTVLECLAHQP